MERGIAASFVGNGGILESTLALEEVSSVQKGVPKLSNFSLGTYAAKLPFL
jgi:hypothetical protein